MAIPSLGDLETAVMDVLWLVHAADAKTVHQSLAPTRSISLNTVQSTVERLVRKGLLRREKVSHAYVYAPALSREAWAARVINEIIGDSATDGMLAAFVDLAASLDDSSLDRLEAMVAARKRQEGKS